MRAAPFPPDEMPPGIRALHEDMAREIKQHLKGFVSKRADGALVGPFAPMLRFPQFGEAAWIYTKALIENSKLPRSAHEVAILVTGAAFNSRYELYAHEHVADAAGLTPSKIAAIAAGQRPADLTEEEAAAYDVAAVLAGGRNLPETTYRRAVAAFDIGHGMRAALISDEQGVTLREIARAVGTTQNAYQTAIRRIRFTRRDCFGDDTRFCVLTHMDHLRAGIGLLIAIGDGDGIKLTLAVIAFQDAAWIFPGNGGAGFNLRP